MTSSAKDRLNHAAIFVSDLDRGIEFYEKAFGLTLEARWITGERITEGKEETIGLPGAHLIESKGCRIEHESLIDPLAHGPADDAPREQIDDRSQIQPPAPGRHEGDIGHRDLVGVHGRENAHQELDPTDWTVNGLR